LNTPIAAAATTFIHFFVLTLGAGLAFEYRNRRVLMG